MTSKYTIIDHLNYGKDTITEEFDTFKEAKEFFLNVGIERILRKANDDEPVEEEYLAWKKKRCAENIHGSQAHCIGKITTVQVKRKALGLV